jgi:transcriptional regulator with XRE-family HTH domain
MRHASTRARAPGDRLRALRAQRRISQLQLALQVGVSQRHLSCIETGRAGVSRATLLALLDALGASLDQRNAILLAAGFSPAYAARDLGSPDLAAVRDAVRRLLEAHEPAPALLLDACWNVLDTNRGVVHLLRLLGLDAATLAPGADGRPFNMLRAAVQPSGLRAYFVNEAEVCGEVWRRAEREAAYVPELAALMTELGRDAELRRADLSQGGVRHGAAHEADVVASSLDTAPPLLLTQLRSRDHGTLSFFSTFTTFGSPLDVTVASLRIEHLFPADDATRLAMQSALTT